MGVWLIPWQESTFADGQRGASVTGSVAALPPHHAQVLVFVLEGSIVMQLEGGAPVTLGPGQTFYEGPDDVHIVSRNASRTAPGRFLVVLVKDKGAPILTPVK
jgi:quercetin dioxygenase-like cupin family protein